MAKAPHDIPRVGDLAELRGTPGVRGKVFHISLMRIGNRESMWAAVRWVKGMGPRVVHLYELRRVEDEGLDAGRPAAEAGTTE